MRITHLQDITDQIIKDVLSCALEGGSNYWYEIVEFGNPDKIECKFEHLDLPMSDAGYLIIKAKEDDPTYRLERITIQQGLQLMSMKYPSQFQDLVNENSDAETGDILLQLSLFGELVYG